MTSVLLINQGHSPNIGDVAIGYVMSSFMERKGLHAINLPFSQDGTRFNISGPFRAIRQHWADIHSELRDEYNTSRIERLLDGVEAKAAIIGGGELLGAHYGFNSAFSIWCRMLKERHIPIAVTGVSGDLNMDERFLNRYGEALRICDYVSARDHTTNDIFNSRYHCRSSYHPDVVFAYNSISGNMRSNAARRYVMVVPVPYANWMVKEMRLIGEKSYFSHIVDILRRHNSSHLTVLLTSTVQYDFACVNKLAEYIRQHTSYDVELVSYSGLEEFVNLLDQTKTVISARMHACILGMDRGCDTVAIPIKQKLKVFAAQSATDEFRSSAENESLIGLESVYSWLRAL